MFARHWFRLLALVLYVAGVGVVLHQCSRQFNPPDVPAPKARRAPVPDVIARQQQQRAARQAEHEEQLQKRKAAYEALETDLKLLREVELPLAMAELSREALRYQNKISDLARLELAARWEREEPVKKARDHAYRLVLEYQAIDQNAQKERDGPTLYQDEAIALIGDRLAKFTKGGEGIANFAAAVPTFAGQVPEKLLLEAIDAIAVVALPADAFDPCRNPLACPKPSPAVEGKTPDKLAAAKPSPATNAPGSPEAFPNTPKRYCLNASRLGGQPLPLRTEPYPSAPMVARIAASSCMITATGHRVELGPSSWLQVTHDYGYTGWVQARFLIPVSHHPNNQDFFSGLFGNSPRRR